MQMQNSLTPSYLEVAALAEVAAGRVGRQTTDGNGHMNVRHIYACAVEGADLLAEQTGMDDRYRSARRMGIFAAEHHIRFFAEMREGDAFSIHPLWVDRAERVGQMIVFMLNRTTESVSSILELAVVHMDLDRRSSVPFPPDIAAELDRRVATTEAISWAMPVSGAVGVRRR